MNNSSIMKRNVSGANKVDDEITEEPEQENKDDSGSDHDD